MRALIGAIALALFAACGGGSDDAATPSPSPSPTVIARATNTPQQTPSPAPASNLPVHATAVPTSTPPGPPAEDAPLYIALGDSLSYGAGASDRYGTAFVPLVHATLPAGTGLLNLGHSGDTSGELIRHGHLDVALNEISRRNGDVNPGNDVVLVTLEIGGNDLLDLFFDYVVPGICPTLVESLQKEECVGILRDALDGFGPNLNQIMDRLQAADPELNIVLMTLYNPFSGAFSALDPFGELSLEGMPDTPFPEGVNDIIRAQAQTSGVTLVEIYPLFVGKGKEYIAQDIIHPNDTGYRVMAAAVVAAVVR